MFTGLHVGLGSVGLSWDRLRAVGWGLVCYICLLGLGRVTTSGMFFFLAKTETQEAKANSACAFKASAHLTG